jgi:hypothetical protein
MTRPLDENLTDVTQASPKSGHGRPCPYERNDDDLRKVSKLGVI